MYTETQQAERVAECKTFTELYEAIVDLAPFVSTSRPHPVTWSANRLVNRIFQYIEGGEPNLITRTAGLRNKVIELKANLFYKNQK